jgi:hypothetical protein
MTRNAQSKIPNHNFATFADLTSSFPDRFFLKKILHGDLDDQQQEGRGYRFIHLAAVLSQARVWIAT